MHVNENKVMKKQEIQFNELVEEYLPNIFIQTIPYHSRIQIKILFIFRGEITEMCNINGCVGIFLEGVWEMCLKLEMIKQFL